MIFQSWGGISYVPLLPAPVQGLPRSNSRGFSLIRSANYSMSALVRDYESRVWPDASKSVSSADQKVCRGGAASPPQQLPRPFRWLNVLPPPRRCLLMHTTTCLSHGEDSYQEPLGQSVTGVAEKARN
jgi:hypothetical protein